jgi:hypothetical protein
MSTRVEVGDDQVLVGRDSGRWSTPLRPCPGLVVNHTSNKSWASGEGVHLWKS